MDKTEKGLVHLYWGEGKGKTTAAVGLALRALGAGLRVSVVQFLKNGDSSELEPLRRLGAAVYSGGGGERFAARSAGEKDAVRRMHDAHLRQAMGRPCELLVLDEACAAWRLDLVDKELLRQAALSPPDGREIVLTGRAPAPWMLEAADYSTEMRCHKHPYQRGIPARKGVEY